MSNFRLVRFDQVEAVAPDWLWFSSAARRAAGLRQVVIDPLSAFFPTGVRGYTEQYHQAALLVRRTDPAGRRDGPPRPTGAGTRTALTR